MTYPHTRAADLDRSTTCSTLDQAFADGQLDAGEHEGRVSQAMAAKTLGELHTLVADLQPNRDRPPAAPAKSQGLRATAAVGAAGLVIGAGLATFLIGAPHTGLSQPDGLQYSVGAPVQPIVAPVPQLLTVDGFDAFLAATRDAFGNTVITRVSVFADSAEVTRPAAGSPIGTQQYFYRGGYRTPIDVPRPPDGADVDLSKLNVPKIIGLVAGAGQSLHVDSPTMLYFEVDGSDGGTVTIHASNAFAQSGSVVASLDGTVLQVNPATN